jgi:hypothetical protein
MSNRTLAEVAAAASQRIEQQRQQVLNCAAVVELLESHGERQEDSATQRAGAAVYEMLGTIADQLGLLSVDLQEARKGQEAANG